MTRVFSPHALAGGMPQQIWKESGPRNLLKGLQIAIVEAGFVRGPLQEERRGGKTPAFAASTRHVCVYV